MKVCWAFCSPCALLLALRIAWEETVLTWSRGPQMVGFSLFHAHPLFAITGLLSIYGLIAWSVAALVFLIVRRKHVTPIEIAMFILSAFVVLVLVIPDTYFAHGR